MVGTARAKLWEPKQSTIWGQMNAEYEMEHTVSATNRGLD